VKKTPYYSSDLQHGCISPAGKALHFSYKKGNSKIKEAGKEQKSRERAKKQRKMCFSLFLLCFP
jgi:hypothetical protein